jgi:PKD repeat protein
MKTKTQCSFMANVFIIILCWHIVLSPLPLQAEINPTDSKSKDWSIVASYTIPGKASGLAWDGTFIYFGIYGANGDRVYRFNPVNGTNELLFTNPAINNSYGMSYDGTCLWITDHGTGSTVPAYALQLDLSGNIMSQFNLPDHYMSGIAYDNGNFWVATYYPNPGIIYKVDSTGTILTQFQSPNEQPWDVCLHGNNLWVADYNANKLYKIDQTGTILEINDCETQKPSGIVFDGQYIWYVDGQLGATSTLYKVDPDGGGTPQISIPVTNFNYGVITVGDSAVWACTIHNTGTADLEITNLVIQNAVPVFVYTALPMTILPGGSGQIEFIYKPTETGPLNTIIGVQSNDPINQQVDLVLTGQAVYSGPHIQIPVTSHNYGTVRMNATTRWFAQIINNGNATLEITNILFDDSRFFTDESIDLPFSVGILEEVDVGIWFSPDEAANITGTAEVFHNDASQGSIGIALSGWAIEQDYPIGEPFWQYSITGGWDNSIKAIAWINDITGDGVADVIVCSEDNYVRCFNGNSSGLADLMWEHEAGTVYGQNGLMIINDIDGDGYQDVIVGLAWGVRAIKALSGKTGELIWMYDTHVYGNGGWVYQVWTNYDYNDDGVNDVLAATGNDGTNTGPKRIFCLDGTDGSVIWDAYADGPFFSVMGVGDFTGDGKPDVIAGASNNNETQGKVYGIHGSTGTINWMFNTIGTSVWALEQLDDVTGDGIKDIVAGDFAGNYYFINPTNGTSFYQGSIGNSLILRFERLDDVNGNNYADIAVAHSGTNAIVIDGYNGQNIWLTALADKCWNIDKIADITGDGISDLVAGTLFSSNFIYFLDGTNGNILHSANFGEAVDAIGAIPDISNDGSWEMVVGGRNGLLQCFSGGLNANILLADFTADTTYGFVPLEVEFTDLSVGNIIGWEWDFNHDGIIDSYDQNPTFTYLQTGVYSVSLTVSDGMNTNTILKEDYITADTIVGLTWNTATNDIKAFPNPFIQSTLITIHADCNAELDLKIYNSSGQPVKIVQVSCSSDNLYEYLWDRKDETGKPVHPGIYFIMVQNNNTNHILKLIVN